MATKAVVKTGTISGSSGTWDFTEAGFGTPDAALIITSLANTTNNPADYLRYSVGVWDGTNQRAAFALADHGATTSATSRRYSETYAVIGTNDATPVAWSASNITDGIRITHASGTTSTVRYVTVVLFGGLSNKAVGTVNLGTGTSAINVNVGFRADLVLFVGAGVGTTNATENAALSFGVAHIDSDDAVSQGCMLYQSRTALADTASSSELRDDAAAGQSYDDALLYKVSVSAYASGFSVTPSANTGSDYLGYLALEFADPADAYVVVTSSATGTGDQAVTGAGLEPDVLLLVQTACTATNTETAGGTFAIGAGGPATTERCIGVCDEDAQAVSDTESYANLTNILVIKGHDGSTDAVAALSSFDSDGWTLNYSDGSASARKMLAIAIGTASAGAVTLTVADASHAHSADAVSLTQAHTLALADSTHSQGVDPVALTQAHTLVLADATHSQAVDPVALTQANTLSLADATHGHSVDPVELDASYTLALADATHGQSADPVSLTQANTLSVQEATQGQTADPVALTQANILVLADATHGHTSDAIEVDTSVVLVVSDTLHTQGVDGSLSLLPTAVLVIADALHAQLADAAGTLDCISISTGSVVCTCEVVAYPLNAGAWLDQESSTCPETGSPSTWKTETLKVDYCNICTSEPWCDINTPPPTTWRTNYDC